MTNKQILAALLKYSKLNEELLNYTSKFYDVIKYDIDGYWTSVHELQDFGWEIWSEQIDTEALQNQIKSVQHLIKGHKLFNPIYG